MPHVLIIEDEPLLREAWVEALTKTGHTAVGVAGGVEALERLRDQAPGLILLDMLMADMDGFEFLARLRANSNWVHIPVLIVSALGEALVRAIDQQAAQTLGVVGILDKPVPLTTMIEYVGKIIGRTVSDGALGRKGS